MTIYEIRDKVIEKGIEAAKRDYSSPEKAHMLEGALLGFESCRDKTIYDLEALLVVARYDSMESYRKEETLEIYWKKVCYEREIEWVCNCLSVLMVQQDLEPIIQPTARAGICVAQILQENS